MEKTAENVELKLTTGHQQAFQSRGYQIGHILQSNNFSLLVQATHNNEFCIGKIMDLTKLSREIGTENLEEELDKISKLRHPYLMEVYDVIHVGNVFAAFIEYAAGGNLLDMISTQTLPEDKARNFYLQFGDALRYMHCIGFAHRDIKCKNILMNRGQTVAKLGESGLKCCLISLTGDSTNCLLSCSDSISFMAPEVLQKTPNYDYFKSDIWSIGVVLYVMLNNKLPFNGVTVDKIIQYQLEKRYKFIRKDLSSDFKDFINLHFNPVANERPSMLELFGHSWIRADLSENESDTTSDCSSNRSSASDSSNASSKS